MDYALIAFGVGCVLVACAVLTACDWLFFVGITLAIVGLTSVFITTDGLT